MVSYSRAPNFGYKILKLSSPRRTPPESRPYSTYVHHRPGTQCRQHAHQFQAEREAQKIVQSAREYRTKRVKDARSEAQKEVEEYRSRKEQEYKQYEQSVCCSVLHVNRLLKLIYPIANWWQQEGRGGSRQRHGSPTEEDQGDRRQGRGASCQGFIEGGHRSQA